MLNRDIYYPGKDTKNLKHQNNQQVPSHPSLSNMIIMGSLIVLIYLIPWIFATFTEEYYEITKNTALLIVVSIIFMVWGINSISKKKLIFFKTPIDIPILIIIIVSIFSALVSINTDTSLWGYHMRISGGLISTFLLIALFYLIINTVKTKQNIITLLKNVVFSILSIALFTILNSVGAFKGIFDSIISQHSSLSFISNGLFSPTGNTNSLAFLFLIALPLVLFLFSNKKGGGFKEILFGTLSSIILLISITITTLSTTPSFFRIMIWVLTVGVLVFNSFYTNKINKGSLGKLFLSIFLVLIALFAFGTTSDNSIVVKLSQKINFSRYYDIPSDTSWSVISGTFNKYSAKSFFLGTGLDTYAYVFPQTRPLSQNLQNNWFENYTRSNTQIESILVNSGILGLLAILIMGYVLIKFLFKKIFTLENWQNNRTLFGLGIFIILYLSSFFIIFHSITFQFFSWLILALFFKLFLMLSRDVEENKIEANFKLTNSKDITKSTNIAPYIFMGLVSIIALITIFSASLNYMAEKYYHDASVLANNSKFDDSYDNLVYSVNINGQRDYYHREISSIALSKLDSIIQDAKIKQSTYTTQQQADLVTTQQYLLTLINSEINKAILLNPNNYENWQRAALIYKKLTELSEGKQFGGDTLKAIEESINKNPNNPDNYLLLGYIYQYNTDNSLKDLAENAYLKAYDLQPSYALSIIQLGSYFEYEGKYANALQLYTISKENVYNIDSAVNKYLVSKISELQTKTGGSKNNTPTPTP